MNQRQPHMLAECDGHQLVAGVVHAHTRASDGEHSVDELVAFAHRKGLGVVCITDHHCSEWRYRWGLRVRRPCVVQFGVRAYLDAIDAAAASSPGPVVLAGIEVLPHYRWEGIPPFLQCQGMKTLVAYGIGAAVIEELPGRLDGTGKSEAEGRQVAQSVIRHIRAGNGLAYWSHLEEDERNRFLTARIRYHSRPELLTDTVGYTGFGCFPHGHRENCRPGGRWDQALAAAAKVGAYNGPWVIGEADYHGGDRDEQYRNICNPVTIFTLRSLEPADVLRALATGRMYAYTGRRFSQSLLRMLQVSANGGTAAGMGETLRTGQEPLLHIKLSGFEEGCRIRIICGGRLWAEVDSREIHVVLPRPEGCGYACRADIASPAGERILTNPIFVAPEQE